MATPTAKVLVDSSIARIGAEVAPGRTKRWYAIRGAATVDCNNKEAILSSTRVLLRSILAENHLHADEIVSAFFVVTRDLTAAYPAAAARQIGWTETALLCASDMEVEGSLPQCVRVLLHVYAERPSDHIHHVYLGEAKRLRPDWARREDRDS